MSSDPTPDRWEPFDDAKLDPSHGRLALRTLRFMAAFTRLQDVAGWFLRGWVDRYPEQAAEAQVDVSELRHLRDSRIVELIPRAAHALSSAHAFEHFANVLERVKTLRDHVAHAMYLNLMVEPDGAPSFGIPYYHSEPRAQRLPNKRSNVDDAILTDRERDLRWLLELVEWLCLEQGFDTGAGTLNRESMPMPPTAPPRGTRARGRRPQS